MPKAHQQTSFTRSLATLFTGTLLAQAIPFLAAPLIARLYDAPQFALFGAALVVFNVINVIITGRYELALASPRERGDAGDLLRGGVVFTVLAGLVAWGVLLLLRGPLQEQLGRSLTNGVLSIVVALALFAGIQTFYQQWMLRERAFGAMARAKVVQAVAITFATILFGYFAHGQGLLLGYFLGWGAYLVCTWRFVSRRSPIVGSWDRSRSIAMLEKYKEFPLHNAWPALVGAIASGVAVMYMALYYPPEIAGQHNFARQYLLAPSSMIGVVVGQLLFERTASAVREDRPIGNELRRSLFLLVLIALATCLIFSLFGEPLFALVFGEQWRFAGQASTILIWGYAVQFVGGAFGLQLLALGKIKSTMAFPLLFAALLALLQFFKHLPPLRFMMLLSSVEVIAYASYLGWVWYHVSRYDRSLNT
ncbi:MAG: oligosaccharide flippase family protein [Flavobacteriales bacterium]|nr:oligosaccharide flippase family protein [Flavobacteriales bacterium]